MMLSIHLLSLTNSTTRSSGAHIDPLVLADDRSAPRTRVTWSVHSGPRSGIIFIRSHERSVSFMPDDVIRFIIGIV